MPAASSVRKDAVFAACYEVMRSGQTPSFNNIYPLIGSKGGGQIVNDFIKDWRIHVGQNDPGSKAQAQFDGLPTEVARHAAKLLGEIWADAQAKAEAQLADRRAQVEAELAQANARTEEAIQQQRAQQEQFASKESRLRAEYAQLQDKCADLMGQLAQTIAERDRAVASAANEGQARKDSEEARTREQTAAAAEIKALNARLGDIQQARIDDKSQFEALTKRLMEETDVIRQQERNAAAAARADAKALADKLRDRQRVSDEQATRITQLAGQIAQLEGDLAEQISENAEKEENLARMAEKINALSDETQQTARDRDIARSLLEEIRTQNGTLQKALDQLLSKKARARSGAQR